MDALSLLWGEKLSRFEIPEGFRLSDPTPNLFQIAHGGRELVVGRQHSRILIAQKRQQFEFGSLELACSIRIVFLVSFFAATKAAICSVVSPSRPV